MSKKSKIILFLVGLTIFTYLVWDFGLNNILSNLYKTGWYFIPVIGVWCFVYFFNALAWKFILGNNKHNFPFYKIFSLTISGFAINYITPFVGLGGEPYRIAELKAQLGTSRAVSSTILYSMIHFLSSFIFWILIILLAFITLTLTVATKLSLLIALIVFLVITYFFITRHKKGVVKSLFNISLKIPFINRVFVPLFNKKESIQIIDEQITDLYLNRKLNFYLALSSEIISRIIGSLEYLFILKAIGINITFIEALYINAFSAFMINLFFFMPLELGSREGGLILVLETLNITSSLGIYVGLVNRIRELFWILIGIILIALSGKKANPDLLTETDYEKSTVI
ncbi:MULTISPECIES: lysylphosphatidylglycerol synthase transmembrane domain-containing protein [unclassified Melioribacter]|uniref:lysylphosphatidylglycerol synthase transmembrane domain-containing protein n=1 Tax=unclassified Melioribacter TaxID=2627329 RepID=UPI003BDA825D